MMVSDGTVRVLFKLGFFGLFETNKQIVFVGPASSTVRK